MGMIDEFVLLTHERELKRKTSTSPLLLQQLAGRCEQLVWQRKQSDPFVERGMSAGNTVLLYPSEDALSLQEVVWATHCIVLEGTWQEARKIYNRSPYLKKFQPVTLNATKPLLYRLRRNQKEQGLSTLEAVSEVLRCQSEVKLADGLMESLRNFQQRLKPQAKKNPAD